MSLANWFGWKVSSETRELPEIYPMPIVLGDFVKTDVVTMFTKILTDVLERTQGLSDDQLSLMWDNCVQSSSPDGLITLLAKAMADKAELFLVYDQGINVIRQATPTETAAIRADYAKQAESRVGVFVSFKSYTRSDMIKFYSGLEYCTVSSLHKSMNLSKAVQLKFSDLRSSVSLVDASKAEAQALEIAIALGSGRDVMIDAKDSIETAVPDLTATQASIEFVVNKLSFYLGLPAAYITGEQTTGMGTTGENDTKAIERGLKNYFYSVLKPALDALFGSSVTYKSQDFRMIQGSMDVLRTFALIDDEYLSKENKINIVNSLLGLPDDATGDPVVVRRTLSQPLDPVAANASDVVQ